MAPTPPNVKTVFAQPKPKPKKGKKPALKRKPTPVPYDPLTTTPPTYPALISGAKAKARDEIAAIIASLPKRSDFETDARKQQQDITGITGAATDQVGRIAQYAVDQAAANAAGFNTNVEQGAGIVNRLIASMGGNMVSATPLASGGASQIAGIGVGVGNTLAGMQGAMRQRGVNENVNVSNILSQRIKELQNKTAEVNAKRPVLERELIEDAERKALERSVLVRNQALAQAELVGDQHIAEAKLNETVRNNKARTSVASEANRIRREAIAAANARAAAAQAAQDARQGRALTDKERARRAAAATSRGKAINTVYDDIDRLAVKQNTAKGQGKVVSQEYWFYFSNPADPNGGDKKISIRAGNFESAWSQARQKAQEQNLKVPGSWREPNATGQPHFREERMNPKYESGGSTKTPAFTKPQLINVGVQRLKALGFAEGEARDLVTRYVNDLAARGKVRFKQPTNRSGR